MENWIETYTGKRVDIFHMTEEDIDLRDIVHALSLTCRYSGHCAAFYSVAQHTILVNEILSHLLHEQKYKLEEEAERVTHLTALLHDASEAYLNDIPTPLKQSGIFKEYRELERRIQGVIMRKYGATGGEWDLVKQADRIATVTEAEILMRSGGAPIDGIDWYHTEGILPFHDSLALDICWSPKRAEKALALALKGYLENV